MAVSNMDQREINCCIYHSQNKHINNIIHKIVIDNIDIQKKSHVKFLGIFLDEHLNWNKQYDHIYNQIYLVPLELCINLKMSYP